MKHFGYLIAAGTVLALAAGCGGGGKHKPKPPPTPTHTFGLIIPSVAEVKDSPKALTFGSSAGSSADLTTTGFLPPVGDQGQIGSCVAWAVGYGLCTYEIAHTSNQAPASTSQMASPADLYNHLLQIEHSSCGQGTQPSDAFDYLGRSGVQSLASVPYNQSCSAITTSGGPFTLNGAKSLFNANGTQPDNVAIKQALTDGHPVALAIQVPSDFAAWGENPNNSGGVYTTHGSLLNSGHMLLIVGFDDSRSAYKIMNSWNTNWGDGGFFWMSYSTFNTVARQAYQSSASTNIPPVNPSAQVTMQMQAVEYFYQGYYYLVFPFQLSEPMYVQAFSAQDPMGGSTGWLPANQWTYTDYVWFVQPFGVPWMDGTYTLNFSGQTRDGRSVNVSATAAMQPGTTALRAPAGVEQALKSIEGRSPRPTGPSGFTPGGAGMANGRTFTIGTGRAAG